MLRPISLHVAELGLEALAWRPGRSSMSEAQPPPRIRIGLPLTLNRRWPFSRQLGAHLLDAEAYVLLVGERAVHVDDRATSA